MQRKKQIFKPHIVHRRHSFQLLPSHHTSYSLLGFMLLLVGIFSVGWTNYVEGQTSDGGSYNVRAIVAAEALAEPATINAPANGARFTEQMITVSGRCPGDSYVHLRRNNVFAAAVLCVNGGWSVRLSLVNGENLLQAQVFNTTDQPGPVSTTRTVVYDPPITTSPASEPGGVTTTEPLVISGGFSFMGIRVGDLLTQNFTINGGQAPYAITIDWGDGVTDIISRAQAGAFSASHRYRGPGAALRSSYPIIVNARDLSGQKASVQTMAIVTQATSAEAGNSVDDSGTMPGVIGDTDQPGMFSGWWRIAAPMYGVTTVAMASFWFGQHRELELLRQHAHRPKIPRGR